MPVIPAINGLRQKDCEFEASLGYIHREIYLKTKQKMTLATKKNSQNTNEENNPFKIPLTQHQADKELHNMKEMIWKIFMLHCQ
jgi:hypothetical protein